MTQNSTPLQNVNRALDILNKLKTSQNFFRAFDSITDDMSYSQSRQSEILQMQLIKDAYESVATAAIAEMEARLKEVQNCLGGNCLS